LRTKIASDTWRGAATAGRDLVRFGLAISIAAGFSAVQVFVIPRLLDVTTYGEYRLFLVYVGYIALLHLGVADGAFLRWVGCAPSQISREWGRISRWIIATHAGFLALALAVSLAVPSANARVFVVGLAACALCANVATLAAYALQASGDFTRAGRVAILSNGMFVALVLLASARSLGAVLALYVTAFGIAAAYGAWGITHLRAPADAGSTADLPRFRDLVRSGSPVLGASLAAALAQSVDRVLVSFFTPMSSFALYGFASTASVAAASATQALSRVALSHAARRPGPERAAFLAGYFDVIATGFGLALAGLPLFERLVTGYIPAYAAALPIVRALTLGLPFWVATHVVIVGTLQSYGLVRHQLGVELGGVLLVVALCTSCLVSQQPLWIVASASSVAAVLTLFLGALVVFRSNAPIGMRAALLFGAVSVLQGGALLLALMTSGDWLRQTLLYALLSFAPTALAARRARAHGW
jgi:O-antigen/teichoic acid export membrane protein